MKREKRDMIRNAICGFKLHGVWGDQKRAIKDVIKSNDKTEIQVVD